MNTPTFLNPSSLIPSAHVLIPARLNAAELNTLLNALGQRPLILLIEEDGTLPATLATQTKPYKVVRFSGAMPDLAADLGADGVALFLPSLVTTLKGNPHDIQTATLRALCATGLPISPLVVHRTADSKLGTDSVLQEPSSIMKVAAAVPAAEATPQSFLRSLLIATEECFSSRQFLTRSLSSALFNSLYHNGEKNFIHDGIDGARLSFRRLHAAALALSDMILKKSTNQRVGIILPPGKGGLIANLAVIFAGKVPVNLNFTAGRKSIESAIRQAELDYFITATPFMEKMPDFAWPESDQLLKLDEVVKALKPKALAWMLKLKLSSPARIIQKRGLHLCTDHDEAILLFTSGSSGEPKGVPLSNRNLLANICQFSSRLGVDDDSTVLGCLPLFHSFGATVTTFFPLLEGHNIVTYASPLETKKLAELIDEHDVTFLCSTPTFLRGYLRNAKPEQFQKLKFVITGAEKLPQNLAETFQKRLGHLPLEGYGLTETSPVSYVNLPTPPAQDDAPVLSTAKPGTVGMPLAGVAIRITDPATGAELPLSQSGCIWLKGANIFPGYLHKPELTAEVIQDGWFNTGDIGHVDEDGFLTLDGRLSRFSKIAGEMVPHETVEAEINKILGLDEETERKTAIVGVPDEKKGEALVLLSSVPEHTADGFINELKQRLIAADIPALWCPRRVQSVEKIPILASGKLDLAGCKQVVG